MPKKGFIPNKLKPWIEARKKYHLSHSQIQMARELGLNPKKIGGMANHKQEPWKVPLPEYIEYLYEKRFGTTIPKHAKSIEVIDAEKRKKKAKRKQERNETQCGINLASVRGSSGDSSGDIYDK